MYLNATLSKSKFVMRVHSNFTANETIKNGEKSSLLLSIIIYDQYK